VDEDEGCKTEIKIASLYDTVVAEKAKPGTPQSPSRLRHSRQKVQARSAVPFVVELLSEFQVDGTWNVPTTLTWGSRTCSRSSDTLK